MGFLSFLYFLGTVEIDAILKRGSIFLGQQKKPNKLITRLFVLFRLVHYYFEIYLQSML